MPLLYGKESIGRNIKTEMAHGKSKKQSVAIALSVARKTNTKRKGQVEAIKKAKT